MHRPSKQKQYLFSVQNCQYFWRTQFVLSLENNSMWGITVPLVLMSHACQERARENCSSSSHKEDSPLGDKMHASSSASYIKIVHLIYSILPCVTEQEQMLDKFLHLLLLVDPFSSSFPPPHGTLLPQWFHLPHRLSLSVVSSSHRLPFSPVSLLKWLPPPTPPYWFTPPHWFTPPILLVTWSVLTMARNR